MPTGYLVTLGDGNLDAGDVISGGAISFTADSGHPFGLGSGQWTWTGDAGGDSYTDEVEPGQYWLSDSGDVYFAPSYGPVDTITSASATTAPTYSSPDDGIVTGTSGDDVIDGGYTDTDGDVVDGGDGTGTLGHEDVISAGAGNDVVAAWLEDDIVYGGSGGDTIDGGAGDDVLYGDTDPPVAPAQPVSITTSNFTNTGSGFTVSAQNVVGGVLGSADVANIGTYAGSFGASGSVSDTDSGVDNQIAYDKASGLSENLTVDFDTPIDELSFTTFSLRTSDFGEVGHYALYDGGTLVYESDFTDSTGTGNDTITVSGHGDFDQIVFTALIQTDLTDGSDYGISDITFVPGVPEPVPGDDVIDGGSGDDVIEAGGGSDSVTGGTGNDTIDLGADTDRDFVVLEDGSGDDEISSFDMSNFGDGTTIDQLDVSGLNDAGGNPVNAWDVVVTDTNGDGTGDAILTFPNGESITLQGVLPSQVDSAPELNAIGIPCFTAGTLIETPIGATAVEALRPGDLVTTLEHGPKPVRWTASSELGDESSPLPDDVLPVRIKPATMGNRLPLVVSPQHCILMTDKQKGKNIYVRAKHLAEETRLASFARGRKCVTYVHILLDQHATLISNGIPSESFYPGPLALETLSVLNRIDLHVLIPGLTLKSVDEAYGPRAAPVLKRREVRKLKANGALAYGSSSRSLWRSCELSW